MIVEKNSQFVVSPKKAVATIEKGVANLNVLKEKENHSAKKVVGRPIKVAATTNKVVAVPIKIENTHVTK